VLRRYAGSRYPLLYQMPFWADTWVCPYTPTLLWYNAAIGAILDGLYHLSTFYLF